MAIAKKPKWAQVILNFVERFCDKEKWVLWFKIVVACLPTIVIALPFDDFIEEHFNNYVVVAIALIVYGVLFIIVENYNKKQRAAVHKSGRFIFQDGVSHRLFSGAFRYSWYIQIWFYHHWRNPGWYFPYRCS